VEGGASLCAGKVPTWKEKKTTPQKSREKKIKTEKRAGVPGFEEKGERARSYVGKQQGGERNEFTSIIKKQRVRGKRKESLTKRGNVLLKKNETQKGSQKERAVGLWAGKSVLEEEGAVFQKGRSATKTDDPTKERKRRILQERFATKGMQWEGNQRRWVVRSFATRLRSPVILEGKPSGKNLKEPNH